MKNTLLKAAEVAEILDVPLHAVWRAARNGNWPFTVKITDQQYRFSKIGLQSFIKNGGMPEKSKKEVVKPHPLVV